MNRQEIEVRGENIYPCGNGRVDDIIAREYRVTAVATCMRMCAAAAGCDTHRDATAMDDNSWTLVTV